MKHPETIIYHIDVNSAFLSWEACRRKEENQDGPDLRDIPSVVGGNQEMRHGIVLAKSLPAKKYKIQTGEPLVKARQKCPSLTVVPPDYELYVACSRKLIELLRNYSPTVEQYSIDEAFVDMTGMKSLYGDPVIFAHQLKDKIYEDLGFTVNIGVSRNKLLAKMASDFKKPNMVHSLFPWEIEKKMWPLPVGDLFFVGRRTEKKLLSLGITTIGELAHTDRKLLQSIFKSHGDVIWNYANGNDVQIVTDHQVANKGYGNSLTIHFDVTDAQTAKMVLLSLTETVGARIRADKAYISVVAVSIVDNEFNYFTKQATLFSPTNVTEVIYKEACCLFDQLWSHTPIRQLGVHTSRATKSHMHQYSLFDLGKEEKLERLNEAVDSIRNRYGEDSIKRACFLGSECEHMTGGIDKAKRTGISGKEV